MLRPTKLRYVALARCDRLAGALTYFNAWREIYYQLSFFLSFSRYHNLIMNINFRNEFEENRYVLLVMFSPFFKVRDLFNSDKINVPSTRER